VPSAESRILPEHTVIPSPIGLGAAMWQGFSAFTPNVGEASQTFPYKR
jgi:hypothetical protein